MLCSQDFTELYSQTRHVSFRCWGLNINGQIGVGTTTNVLTPTKISQLGAVSLVSAGSYHTCVITMMEATFDAREDENGRVDGNVYCFGSNSFGQLGIGNREDQSLPQKVNLGGMAQEIKAGRDHTCAIMEDDTVKVRRDSDSYITSNNSVHSNANIFLCS